MYYLGNNHVDTYDGFLNSVRQVKLNEAVYTTTFVAGGWAGAIMNWAGAVMIWAGAVMIWAGAVMIWAGACSNTNFPTLEIPKSVKKS